jgi:hypothetical protein
VPAGSALLGLNKGWRVEMENLAELGIFFGGLGVMFLSFAAFWAVSEWRGDK